MAAFPTSAPIEGKPTIKTAVHTSVKQEQSSKTIIEEVYSIDESSTQSTTSATIRTEITVPVSTEEPPCNLPFDVQTRFQGSICLCIALAKSGERCKHRVKSSKLVESSELVQNSLTALATHYSNLDHKGFMATLKEFTEQALCKRSHHTPAINLIKTFETESQKGVTKERYEEYLVEIFNAGDAAAFFKWANTVSGTGNLSTENILVMKHDNGVEAPSILSAPTTDIDLHKPSLEAALPTSASPTTKAPKDNPLGCPQFAPHLPKRTKYLPTSVALQQVIENDLTKADLNSGFIYIFWLKGMSWGHLKIGRSKDPRQRIQQWNSQCKHEHVFIDDMVEVPHVNRVERLMHMELKEIRKSMKCEGCGRVHSEWFEISEDDAKRVFLKWKDWIIQQPYEMDSAGKWRLKPSFKATMADVCQPLLLHSIPNKPIGPRKPKHFSRNSAKVRRSQGFVTRSDATPNKVNGL